ncbi:hypothetical protein K8P63_03535 [Sphingomonas nostoxanthinifaciens]|nr:hypothetical protein K8P63_03535 [Sphingomonas nostoxanthinifaciens]
MTRDMTGRQWPKIGTRAPVRIPTPHGDVFAQLAELPSGNVLVYTAGEPSDVPVVRFQSACVFGEGLRAKDCDCGVQLDAAVKAICDSGGVMTYAWEEGRGAGIARKLDAIALQQEKGVNTGQAFEELGMPIEPRDFDNHVIALRKVFDGFEVRFASRNPAKIAALGRAGIGVSERITLETEMTDERVGYLASKLPALGHIDEP